MLFTKTKLYKNHRKPIDCGYILNDGNRLFGDNKTIIGFLSMILFCTFLQIIHGIVCSYLNINQFNELYDVYGNSFFINLFFGFLCGFMYMFFELPNSFLKRRFNINPGETTNGFKGKIFFVIDQIDSLIGVFLLLFLFSDISIGKYFLYIFMGGLTHIIVNLTLKAFKVRKRL